jgi:peroxiredoxin family protein
MRAASVPGSGSDSIGRMLAAILESGDPERLYTGLSLLVTAATMGRPVRGFVGFGALVALAQPAPGEHVIAGEREPFVATLTQLRDAALALPDCRLYACAAAIQATGADYGAFAGMTSMPQFLRETEGAELVFV